MVVKGPVACLQCELRTGEQPWPLQEKCWRQTAAVLHLHTVMFMCALDTAPRRRRTARYSEQSEVSYMC